MTVYIDSWTPRLRSRSSARRFNGRPLSQAPCHSCVRESLTHSSHANVPCSTRLSEPRDFAGLKIPGRPVHAAGPSHEERGLVWTLIIESGHIPLRTKLGTCNRDMYRPLRQRLLVWTQRIIYQDLHNVWQLIQANRGSDRLTHAPSLPIRCFPVTRRSKRLRCPVTPKVWPAWSKSWKP